MAQHQKRPLQLEVRHPVHWRHSLPVRFLAQRVQTVAVVPTSQTDARPHTDLQLLQPWELLDNTRELAFQKTLQLPKCRWHHRCWAHRKAHEQAVVPRDAKILTRALLQETALVKLPAGDCTVKSQLVSDLEP